MANKESDLVLENLEDSEEEDAHSEEPSSSTADSWGNSLSRYTMRRLSAQMTLQKVARTMVLKRQSENLFFLAQFTALISVSFILCRVCQKLMLCMKGSMYW